MKTNSYSSLGVLGHSLGFLLFLALVPAAVRATPYATCLTNTGSSISFRLNESADNVKVISGGGTATNELGALPAGLFTASLVISGAWEVQVSKAAGAGYLDGIALQISDDNNNNVKFWSPRGVAVNQDAASPYFGRIYVANATPGTSGGRQTNPGIYVLNSDQSDALGQGDVPRTGGIEWADTNSAENVFKPWKIEVGEDGNLYVADATTATGNLYVTDPDVSPGSGNNVLTGFGSPTGGNDPSTSHGFIASSAIVTGSLGTGTLTIHAMDGDLFPVNHIRRWDIGSGPLPSSVEPTLPTDILFEQDLLQIRRVLVDMDISPEGRFYLFQRRAIGVPSTINPGVIVMDPAVDDWGDMDMGPPNGKADWVFNSLFATQDITGSFETNDFLYETVAGKVSPDGRLLAVLRGDGQTWIIPLDAQGIPDLLQRKLINTGTVSTSVPRHDICFDAVGNLYVVNTVNERLRIFSPGLNSIATTSSAGSVTVTNFAPEVATVDLAGDVVVIREGAANDTASLTFRRVGGDTALPLTVNFTLGGTAQEGIDYQSVGSSIVIPANETSVTLNITALDRSGYQGNRTIIIALAPGGYIVSGNANSVTVALRDNDLPEGGTTVLTEDFESDTSAQYKVNTTADASATFAYDYSADGIAPAPNSVGGTTRGLKFQANISAGAAHAVSVSPLGRSLAGDYILSFDMWINANGPFPGGGTGSTEFLTGGVGVVDDNQTIWANNSAATGGWFGVSGEGGASQDFRAYKGNAQQTVGSGQYEGPSQDNFSTFYHGTFPGGQEPPLSQQNAYPDQQYGALPVGAVGFAWRQVVIAKIGNTVSWQIDGLFIATLDTAIGDFSTSGNIFVGYMDVFTSVSDNAALSFGLVDNLRVVSISAPEESTVELAVDKTRINEPFPNGPATLTFRRVGGNSSVPLTVNFTLGGTAAAGTDYQAIGNTAVIPAEQTTVAVPVTPIDNNLVDGDRTVIVTVAPGSYQASTNLNTVTVTILDDDLPSGTVAFSESFDTDTSAQYAVNTTADASATFSYDYSADGIPPAPNSQGGTTRGIKFQANLSAGAANAVSVSPLGRTFAGDYILRFDMWINVNGPFPGGGTGSTEFLTGGVGVVDENQVIWGNNAASSGGWFAVDGEGGTTADFRAYKGPTLQTAASGQYVAASNNSLDTYYHVAFPGGQEAPPLQQSTYPQQTGGLAAGTVGFGWREVEIAKLGNTVVWQIDGLRIATLDTAVGDFSTAGNIFVGYMDVFSSVSDNPALSFGLVDNLRVEGLGAPAIHITGIAVVGGEVRIAFAAAPGDAASAFKLRSSATVEGPYTVDGSAVISELAPPGTGLFRATAPVNGLNRFYFVER